MEVFEGDKKREKRKHPLSESAKTRIHPLTKIPKRVVKIDNFPAELKEGTVQVTEESAPKVFKNFLRDNKEFFGVDADDLKPISSKKIRGKLFVKYQQHYKGIPVFKGSVGIDASENGKIGTYSANYHPNIDIPTTPQVSLDQAVQVAKETYEENDRSKLKMKDSIQIIYPEKNKKNIVYHLAWKFQIVGDEPDPEIEKIFIIDAIDGAIITQYTAHFPGARVYGQVRGQVHAENPTDPVSTVEIENEYVDVDYAGQTTTDDSGDYSKEVPWYWWIFEWLFSPDCTFKLRGPYVSVRASGGAEYRETRPCSTSNPCNHTWIDNDRDHINVFYHMNLFHDWLKSQLNYNWRNPWENSGRFNARVNYTFNNAYAGDPIKFGTANFARSSDVIYHECIHNVLYELYGDYIGYPDTYSEAYAMDEGFADYFASSITDDPRHGEGYGGTRTLDNTRQYVGKDNYNTEGHTGGMIIGGAAWDLRQSMISINGPGQKFADNLIFDAHQILSTYPRDYYFSDPQESNLLSALYIADDVNNNLIDFPPHFILIHDAFANHNLLQAVLENTDSFDFSANIIDYLSGGDLYYSGGKFWANNYGQRGLQDLGDIGNVALKDVSIPSSGYYKYGVDAVEDHTYVSLAHEGEEGNHIVFRLKSIANDQSELAIEYYYRKNLLMMLQGVVIDLKRYVWKAARAEAVYKDLQFAAKGEDLIGFIDLGDLKDQPLEDETIPTTGYKKADIKAIEGHTYIAMTTKINQYIAFKVHSADSKSVTIEILNH